jgi:PKD repeat protein
LHNWIFGDGSAGDASANPVHSYASPGSYFVKHYILNQAINCKDSIITEIRVPQIECAIAPAFSFYKDSQDCRKIHFVNQSSTSSAAHFVWKFGDGTTSTDVNPTHVYPVDSNYNVCLQMETANNCSREICKVVEVRCAPPPCNLQSVFVWKSEPENPRKVFFYNQTIIPSANVKYEWKFGDGSSSDQRDPVHMYEHPGDYEVCLTVKISENCKSTSCQKITIHDCDVHAKFESKRDPSQWNKVWFNNLSQPVPNIWRTSWTYGDGSSSQDFNTYHVYPEAGKYFVCLKVQSLQGCIDTYCDSIIVRRVDSCENHSDFHFEASMNNPLEIRFKPVQVNLTWKYYWDFGDGKSSTAVTPVHKYDHAGEYKVCLSVVALNHCRTQTCKDVRVMPAANCDTVKLKFIYTRTQQHPNQVSFYAVSNVTVLSQKWVILQLGGQITAPPIPVVIETNNPTYTFRDTGWYMVCLYGRTLGDCNKVYCDRVHIERLGNSAEVPGSSAVVVPNPATNTARIEFEMEQSGPVSLRVLDAAGASQFTLSAEGQAGNNRISIPVNKLSNGFYMVEIRYGNRLKLAKFQKS